MLKISRLNFRDPQPPLGKVDCIVLILLELEFQPVRVKRHVRPNVIWTETCAGDERGHQACSRYRA